jgi:hypothetical protein
VELHDGGARPGNGSQQKGAPLITIKGSIISTVQGVSVSPDGALLAVPTNAVVEVWDIASGIILRKLTLLKDGHLNWVYVTDWHTHAKERNALQNDILAGHSTAASVRELVTADDSVARSTDDAGRLPLHLVLHAQRLGALSGDDETVLQAEEAAEELQQVVEILLEAYPAAIHAKDPETQNLPLHFASRSPRVSASLFLHILDRYPAAAQKTGEDGMLPLHTLVKFRGSEDGGDELVRQLLEVNPSAASIPLPEAQKGGLPARLAVETRATGSVVRLLLEAYPKAAEEPVTSGSSQFLMHVALQQLPVIPDVVQVLLELGPRHTVFQAIRDPKLSDAVGRAVARRPELAWTV